MAGTMPANRDDPDAPGAGSLNVAVAAGILIQAFTRDFRSGEAAGYGGMHLTGMPDAGI